MECVVTGVGCAPMRQSIRLSVFWLIVRQHSQRCCRRRLCFSVGWLNPCLGLRHGAVESQSPQPGNSLLDLSNTMENVLAYVPIDCRHVVGVIRIMNLEGDINIAQASARVEWFGEDFQARGRGSHNDSLLRYDGRGNLLMLMKASHPDVVVGGRYGLMDRTPACRQRQGTSVNVGWGRKWRGGVKPGLKGANAWMDIARCVWGVHFLGGNRMGMAMKEYCDQRTQTKLQTLEGMAMHLTSSEQSCLLFSSTDIATTPPPAWNEAADSLQYPALRSESRPNHTSRVRVNNRCQAPNRGSLEITWFCSSRQHDSVWF